jgi:tetratricopeptide (TPR) repeat protein
MGIVGRLLGDDDEKAAVEAIEPELSADAFAAAVAARLSASDPEVARDTSAYLKKQAQLLETQNKHLKEEHALRLIHLRGESREGTLRRIGMRLRLGFMVFVALLSTAIGIGLAVIVRDAATSRRVVIEPFDVPAGPATAGINGKIVAAGLLDVLRGIQSANRTTAEGRQLANAWTSEISVEIPETGLSVGQIERVLKDRLGHDQHVEGDLIATEKGGLALTVRANGMPSKTFTDEGRNLDQLLTQAGEYVYSRSQPGLWNNYLVTHGRADEAIAFSKANYAAVDASEKPYVLNGWGNAILIKGGATATAEALPFYREAVRLKPDYWVAYNNMMDALMGVGDEEGAVQTGEQLRKLGGGRPGRVPESMYQNYDELLFDLPAYRADQMADLEAHGGVGTSITSAGAENLSIATTEAQMHDTVAPALRLKTTSVDTKDPASVAAIANVRAFLAEEAGDLKAAAREWDNYAVAYADPFVSANSSSQICFAAVTYEKTGQPAKADAALKPYGGAPFVDCYRFKGDVLDLRGDWAGAQEWYARAVKLGPSMPAGYYSWGMALFRHGDLEGAAAKFKDANHKSPHWADPLKAWGDVLVKQGNTKDALAKYDEALKYAPNWMQLKQARDSLAKPST